MAHDPNKWTVILVSGAWHVSIHCQQPMPYFISRGYHFVPLPLPAAGNKSSTLEENISAISDAINVELAKPHQKVAAIFHSAAGLIGTEAINQILTSSSSPFSPTITARDLAARIRIIYLASIFEWGPIVHHLSTSGNLRIDTDLNAFWCDRGYPAFYDEMSEQDAKPFVEALTFQKAIEAPVLTSEAWRECDLTHVVCTQDKLVPAEWQVELAREFGMRVAEMEATHCPYVCRPREFVEVVAGVLKRDIGGTD